MPRDYETASGDVATVMYQVRQACVPLRQYEVAIEFRVFHRTVRQSHWSQRLVAQQFKYRRLNIRQAVDTQNTMHKASQYIVK